MAPCRSVVKQGYSMDVCAEAGTDDPTGPEDRALQTKDNVQKQLLQVQEELDALRDELKVLHRRDDTLSFYMQRIDEKLRLAARLQQDFLPKSLPQVGSVHFNVLFRPAGYVSGDLYD